MLKSISLRAWAQVFALLLGFLVMVACAGLQEKPSVPSASLVITPNSGQAASNLTIRGSGFVPGEKIEVLMVVDGVSTELGDVPMIKQANEVGAFKTQSAIPLTAQPGIYTVKAIGDQGTSAVAPLEVEAKPEKKK